MRCLRDPLFVSECAGRFGTQDIQALSIAQQFVPRIGITR